MTDGKLCLQWNDFQNIVQTTFSELRSDSDFTDVTLACEDQSIKAHKVILSACSPFFKRLLKNNPSPQPLIYMRGLKSSDLVAVVDFIYRGEVNIFQEQLEMFLTLAEELELKGLDKSSKEETPEHPQKESFTQNHLISLENTEKYEAYKNGFERAIMAPMTKQKQTSLVDPQTMATIEAMIEKHIDGFVCTECDYKSNRISNVKEHAEKHIGGLEYTCNSCSKVFKTSQNIRDHKRRHCQ